jgi:hypothetical protein
MYTRLKAAILRKLGRYPEQLELGSLAAAFKTKYGYLNSVKTGLPVDSNGAPLPWFTYPAIEFLDSLDLREAFIFEWGSGNSSAFFARRCREIESIESDFDWHKYQLAIIAKNQHLRLVPEGQNEYPNAINSGNHKEYDLIVIDGKQRPLCAKYAFNKLKAGGILILDNSDWYPKLCRSFRDQGLMQLDFHGHGPINPYTWTTSVFLSACDPIFSNSLVNKRLSNEFYSKTGLVQVAIDDALIDFISHS